MPLIIQPLYSIEASLLSPVEASEVLEISLVHVHPLIKNKRLKANRQGESDLFHTAKCESCGLVYPNPKFLYSWTCPGCNMVVEWKSCWYKRSS